MKPKFVDMFVLQQISRLNASGDKKIQKQLFWVYSSARTCTYCIAKFAVDLIYTQSGSDFQTRILFIISAPKDSPTNFRELYPESGIVTWS